ncbi:MAG: tRNA lysidine(34) synthetase TilS [Pseudomonas sp.]|nr:tRNA lysidine(34) synthetase TilS [Pseudomonas sp.]
MLDIEKHILNSLQPWLASRSFCIAFSGGLDSTVLLYALACLAKRHPLPKLRAIYIQHGLQEAAQAWPAHCQQVCATLQIPLSIVEVKVAQTASVERAARDARYAAFAEHLHNHEVLLMAQHLDDQAETILFRLLRGAGVSGLRGIPAERALAAGHLLRPLLGISQQSLHNYAQQHHLQWIEDPSNASEGFARNYLRRQIIPALQMRWPSLRTTLQRTAQHMQEAQQLLDELAELDLCNAQVRSPLPWLLLPHLDLRVIRSLSLPRQKNLLRYWLAAFTLPPDSAHWQSWQTLRDAKVDASPVWRLQQGALLRSQNRLYWLPEPWLQEPPVLQLTICCAGRYALPNNGYLTVTGELRAPLQVRYRQGAERMLIEGRGHRDLKRLLQEQDIPAFLRPRLPLVFQQEQLLAVANLPHLNHSDLGIVRIDWQLTAVDESVPYMGGTVSK